MFPRIHMHKTWTGFLLFAVIYLVSILLFAAIYLGLELSGAGHLKEHYLDEKGLTLYALILKCLYFSLVTNLSVGFGDITPFELSRLFASLQAFIGYLLPVALVINLFPNEVKEKLEEEEKKHEEGE
ncbi:two pore domain potassium channel family protein [Metabacillus sp. KIGAM252]|uniref:Two pore domain potassium channel family protein n=1 Tax=Metabacillus flavus TaxID=2823519 RepID=A0ABS5LB18_9BACI|nr:two pore domain potassium channel family protein [Metabacillus flavus]MBS2967906.1 two pore domain potassium channel family protein [Metabacillus flavus]